MATAANAQTNEPSVKGFYEAATGSVQYVVWNGATGGAAIIDPVWNYDTKRARLSTEAADDVLAFVRAEGLTVEWILDTHPHADHCSAVGYLQDALAPTGAKIGTGEKIKEIGQLWRGFVGDPTIPVDGSPWDRLFADGDRFEIGGLPVDVMFSPGHTLASVTFVVGAPAGRRCAFVHDTLFMPDTGTARADFPGGSSDDLYNSLQRILALPDDTRVFVGHDYRCGGTREPAWESTIAEQKATNPHLAADMDRAAYCAKRDARDATLPLPDRMLVALQINLRGGRKPAPAQDGVSYVSLPLDRF